MKALYMDILKILTAVGQSQILLTAILDRIIIVQEIMLESSAVSIMI